MTTTDPVGTAVASLGAGATTGAAVITGGMVALRIMQGRGVDLADAGSAAALVGSSLFLGLASAAGTGWIRSRPIPDVWRRGVVAALSVFGAALLSLVCIPVDVGLGPSGLLGYLLVLATAATITTQAARRAGRR